MCFRIKQKLKYFKIIFPTSFLHNGHCGNAEKIDRTGPEIPIYTMLKSRERGTEGCCESLAVTILTRVMGPSLIGQSLFNNHVCIEKKTQ